MKMLLNKISRKLLIVSYKNVNLNHYVASLPNLKNDSFLSNNLEWDKALPYTSIPGPSKFQLLRNFLPFGKYYKKPRDEFTKLLYEEFGDVVKLPAVSGNPDLIFLFNPEYFEKIYRTEGKWPGRMSLPTLEHYRTVKNPETFEFGSLITAQGESWGKFRSIVNPVIMQPKTIRIYVPTLEKISSQFIDRITKIRDETTKEVPGTFERELNKWALESVCVVALDKNLGLIGDNKNPDALKLFNAFEEIFRSPANMGFNPSFFKYMETPEFKKLMKAYHTITTISQKYIEEAIENYKLNEKNCAKNDNEKSIVERLISVNKDLAVIMALDMFFGGVDPATSAIAGCLLSLAKNPEKQEKLRTELRNILPEKDTKITEEKLKNLPYLRAVIKESIRIYPVTFENARKAGDNIVIKNYQIPKGIDLVMMNAIFYKNEKYFSQSDKFIPERWIRNKDLKNENSKCPIAEKSSNPFVYLPFGFGTRMCIGKRIVEMELEVLLAKIIRNFYVEYNYPEDDVFISFLINTPIKELKFKFIDVEQ